ncbi:hypothetical protein DRQ11_13040, partial [candidate division KSB1 bacterium]
NGFTMESDVFVRVTNKAGCWDAAVIGLTKENAPYWDHPNCPGEGYYTGLAFSIVYVGDACWAAPPEKRRHAYFRISLYTEDGTGEGPGSYAINADDYINGWHNLKIVVGEDRFVSFYCDDNLIYKSKKRIHEDILLDKKIYLGQRSCGWSAGKAYHDYITVKGVSPPPEIDDWPMFRHDPQHTGYCPSTGLNEFYNLKWKKDFDTCLIPFPQITTPVVYEGKVFVGTGILGDYCRICGLVVDNGEESYIRSSEWIKESLAVLNNRIFASPFMPKSTWGPYFSCYDATTKDLLWCFPDGYLEGISEVSAPTVFEDKVLISVGDAKGKGVEEGLYCLRIEDGEKVWVFPSKNRLSSPAVANGMVFVSSGDKLYCLDMEGNKKWEFLFEPVDYGRRTLTPAIFDDMVFVSSGDKVYCLDMEGNKKWDFHAGYTSPAVADGKVFVGFVDVDNLVYKIYCINMEDGEEEWSTSVKGRPSFPVIADGKVFIAVEDELYCLSDEKNGEIVWKYNFREGRENYGVPYLSSPIVAEDKVFITALISKIFLPGVTARIYCFESKNIVAPLIITAYSPVDLSITDLDGLTIDKHSTEIPNATYAERDIDGDGEFEAQIIIPDRKIGNYQITVIPKPNAESTDTYSLEVLANDTIIVLAEDVPISEIPDQPYVIESADTGIMDRTPPIVTDHLPTGTDVPVTTTINVTFSEAMNQSSVQNAFTISPTATGSFSWTANTMTFMPSSLTYATTYEVIIGTEAKDLAGNHLQSPYTWSFTTASPVDIEPPIIESVTLDAYTTIPDATIHVTVEVTDNVGVTSVTADGVDLEETGSIWEGDITAPSAIGDYTLTITAGDAANNTAETTVDYSVVKPSGSIGIGVDPRLTTVNAGDTAFINIRLVSTENFDDIAYVYLTTEGVYPGYEANLTWFNWTSKYVKVPAGAVVN